MAKNTQQKQYDSFPTFKTTFPSSSPGIALVEINNPSKLNALSPAAFSELPPLFSLLSNDPTVLAIILSGSGIRAFSAGLDISAAASPSSVLSYAQAALPSPRAPNQFNTSNPNTPPDPARVAFKLQDHILDLQSSVTAIGSCRKPVIAALHGHCLGAGLDLACCADVRLASPSTAFSVREVHIGLAADLGVLSRLPKIVGNGSWVKDVSMTGRIFGAEEAKREGLVSWVGAGFKREEGREEIGVEDRMAAEKIELVEKAMALAREIARLSPVAVQGTKALLDYSVDHSIAESLQYTAVWNSAMLQTSDIRQALATAKTKEKPTFSKL